LDPDPEPIFFLLNILRPFDVQLILPSLVLLFLLIASALVSGSEVAFFSIKAPEIEAMRGRSKSSAERVNSLLDHPKTLLATILISNNFINVGIVILSTFLTNAFFDFTDYPTLGFGFQIIGITFLILLFGEVLPKVYANKQAATFASFMSTPMMLLRTFCRPLSKVLVRSTSFIEKRLQSYGENLSVDDLSQALELANEDTTDEEQKILEGIVKFGSTTVKQIMKPRMDVVCIDESWDYEKVMQLILDSGYSRIPVYKDTFDQVQGVLYIKDLIPYIDAGSDFNWVERMRDSFFVPENKKIDDLLQEFQEKKIHMAVVVDEFGGTSGIITLEDIIEEIVGEISDEFDDEDLVYSKLDDKNYTFEGKIHLTDFVRVVGMDIERLEEARGEADTLAGFLLEVAGKFPEAKEEIVFAPFIFTVESLEGRRIKRIKVTLTETEGQEHEA
jgi:gliding motility-associated protein GldE